MRTEKIIRANRLGLVVMCAVVGCAGLVLFLVLRPDPNPADSGPQALENISIEPRGREAGIRKGIRDALDADGGMGPLGRLDLLRRAPEALTDLECQALLSFLLQARGAVEPEGRHSELFHETALLLAKQDAVREDFARVLATVARDDRRDLVVRDYALQHLRQVWERSEPALQEGIVATFTELAGHASELSASALLSLHLLGTGAAPLALVGPNAPEVGGLAVSDEAMAGSVRAILEREPAANSLSDRMTALRIVGDRHLDGFREELKQVAADSQTEHALVRMAAVAALARFGRPDDLAFLEGLDRSDPRVASAIDHAVSQLQTR